MAGFLVVPAANAEDDLSGAVVDLNENDPATLSGLVNGTSYRAYRLSDASDPFTPVFPEIVGALAASYTPSLTASFSGTLGPVAVTINSVTVGAQSGDEIPLTIDTVETPDGASLVYWVLVSTGDTAPTAAEIRAGQESGGGSPLDAGSFTWTASPGNQTLAEGINEACDIYVVIDNGVLSNVENDLNFAINTLTGLAPQYLGEASLAGGSGASGVYTFSGLTLGTGTIVVVVSSISENQARALNDVSIDGSSATLFSGGGTDAAATSAGQLRTQVLRRDGVTSATGDIVVTMADNVNDGITIRWYLLDQAYTVTDVAIATSPTTAPWETVLDLNVADGGCVFGGAAVISNNPVTIDASTITNLTQDGTTIDVDSNDVSIAASATGLTAETPRTVRIGGTGGNLLRVAAAAVSLEPA